jgi:hypothetical protein
MEELGPMCDVEIVRFSPTLEIDGGGAQHIGGGGGGAQHIGGGNPHPSC